MMGKILITHQTGPEGKEVKRLYIEEASDISKEFYLSCLIDRESSKIAFISSIEGGVDIEKVAAETPHKIITTKIDLKSEGPSKEEIENIISIFSVDTSQKTVATKLVNSLYKILIEKGYDNSTLFANYGLILINFGKLKDAEFFIRKAINLNPKDSKAHYNLGNVLKELGKLQE